ASPRQHAVPRGGCRLGLTAVATEAPPVAAATEEAAAAAPSPRRSWLAAAAAAALVAARIGIGWALRGGEAPAAPSGQASLAASPVWQPLSDDSLPALIVVGDYYIFGELDERADVARLVRNFGVNSSRELDELLMYEPDLQARYMDLDLTYLPRATAVPLSDLLRVLYVSDKPVRVAAKSELTVADPQANHGLHVGYVGRRGEPEG